MDSVNNIIYNGGKYKKTRKNKNNNNKTKKNKRQHISIKNDPYTHFNGKWISNIRIPKSQVTIDMYSKLWRKNKNIIGDVIKMSMKSSSKSGREVKNIYNSYLHTPHDKIKSHMKEKYNKLCYILSSSDNINDLYEFCIFNGVSMPFSWDISQDNRKRYSYAFYLNDSGIYLPNKDYYLLPKYKKTIYKYNFFLKNLFKIVFGDKNPYNIDSIIEIETYISRIIPSEWEKQNSDKNYNKISHKEISQMGLNWNDFSNLFGFKTPPEKIILNNKKYFNNLFSYMNKNWNKDYMRTYWIYNLLMSFSSYNKNIRNLCFNFFGKIIDGRNSPVPEDEKANLTVCQYMNTYISQQYLQQNCKKENISYIEKLSEMIRINFKKRLINNTWLSKKTKEKAVLKLKNMKFYIGKKEGFIEDPDENFDSNDAYKNHLIFLKWEIKTLVELYFKKYNPSLWDRFEGGDVFSVNAYYNPINNETIIPCGILQKPFVNKEEGIEYALGFLGSTIGHEITHGFDDDGCKYDDRGNFINWWSKDDVINYKKKQLTIMSLYKNIIQADGYNIDIRLSLGENIADIGGLMISEGILEDIYEKNGIDDNEKNKRFKKFYKYYVNELREKSTPQSMYIQMKTNEHLISKYRCNGALMNSTRFQKTYDIKKDDKMFNKNITEIW